MSLFNTSDRQLRPKKYDNLHAMLDARARQLNLVLSDDFDVDIGEAEPSDFESLALLSAVDLPESRTQL